MINRKKTIQILSFIILLILGLFIINRDVLHFEKYYNLNRSFQKENDEDGRHFITDEIFLKEGKYSALFEGENDSVENGYFISSGDQILAEGSFNSGKINTNVEFNVNKGLQKIRTGIIYQSSDSSDFQINSVRLISDRVLYRDSLLRHFVLSLEWILIASFIFLQVCFQNLWEKFFGGLISFESEKIVLFLILLTLVSTFPYLSNTRFIRSDDIFFHMLRIEGIKDSLQAGYFPAKIQLYAIQNYGYGAGFYYPDFWLYIPAVFLMLGFDILTVYKDFIFVWTFLTLLSFYLCIKKLSKSGYAGLISAVIFSFSAYRLIDIFYRGALGEIQAFAFVPVIVYGLYLIFNGKPEKWIVFALGITGVAFSHLISLLIVIIAVGLFVILKLKTILCNKKILIAFLKSIVWVVLINAFFWLPMLEQYLNNQTAANVLLSSAAGGITEDRVLKFVRLFTAFGDWSNREPFVGFSIMLIPFLRLMVGKSITPLRKTMDWMLGFAIFFLMMSTNLFPWKYFSWLFNRIQFTWRLFFAAIPLLSMTGGILCSQIFEKEKGKKAFFCGITAFCLAFSIPTFYHLMTYRSYETNRFFLQENRIGGGEYLPDGAKIDFIDQNKNQSLSDASEFKVSEFNRKGLSFTINFDADNKGNKFWIEVPLLYYKGYIAEYTDENGSHEFPVVRKGNDGLASVDFADAKSGTLRIYYQMTKMQMIGYGISLAALVVSIICLMNKKRKN